MKIGLVPNLRAMQRTPETLLGTPAAWYESWPKLLPADLCNVLKLRTISYEALEILSRRSIIKVLELVVRLFNTAVRKGVLCQQPEFLKGCLSRRRSRLSKSILHFYLRCGGSALLPCPQHSLMCEFGPVIDCCICFHNSVEEIRATQDLFVQKSHDESLALEKLLTDLDEQDQILSHRRVVKRLGEKFVKHNEWKATIQFNFAPTMSHSLIYARAFTVSNGAIVEQNLNLWYVYLNEHCCNVSNSRHSRQLRPKSGANVLELRQYGRARLHTSYCVDIVEVVQRSDEEVYRESLKVKQQLDQRTSSMEHLAIFQPVAVREIMWGLLPSSNKNSSPMFVNLSKVEKESIMEGRACVIVRCYDSQNRAVLNYLQVLSTTSAQFWHVFGNFWVSFDTNFDRLMRFNAHEDLAVFCSLYFVKLHEPEAEAAEAASQTVAGCVTFKKFKDIHLSGLVTSIGCRLLRYPEHFGILQVKVPQTILNRVHLGQASLGIRRLCATCFSPNCTWTRDAGALSNGIGNLRAGGIRRLTPRDWYRFILVNPPQEQPPKHREILFEVVVVSAMTIKQVHMKYASQFAIAEKQIRRLDSQRDILRTVLNWTVYENSLDVESLKFTPLRNSRQVVVSCFSLHTNRFMETGLTVKCATAASISCINNAERGPGFLLTFDCEPKEHILSFDSAPVFSSDCIIVVCDLRSSNDVSLEEMVTSVIESSATESVLPLSDGVAEGSSEGVLESEIEVSLRCPLAMVRIRIPVKGKSCTHVQVFDLESYILYSRQRSRWLCPVCSKPVPLSELRIAREIDIVLKSSGPDVESAIFTPDGKLKRTVFSQSSTSQYDLPKERDLIDITDLETDEDSSNVDPIGSTPVKKISVEDVKMSSSMSSFGSAENPICL